MASCGEAFLSLEELFGITNRQVLEAEITNLEAAGGTLDKAERLKRLGIVWHNLSVLKVSGASKQADKWLKKALDITPADHEVMAYYGSARTMVARDSWNVLTKMSVANKGIALIEKAIRKAPDNVAVRMVRANNSLALPGFFDRRSKARLDFSLLHGRLDKLDLSHDVKAEICFKLGQILEEDGDQGRARFLYEQARTLSPDGQWAQRASEQL